MIKKTNLPSKELKVTAKENLKTMQKNRSRHPIRQKTRIVKYGATSFSRNIWLSTAATLVMIITLIVLFATVIASVVLNNTATSMREKIDITIFLKPGTSKDSLDELANLVKADDNVKSVATSTSEEELKLFMEENQNRPSILASLEDKENYKKTLESMQSTLRVKVHNPDDLTKLKSIVESESAFARLLDEERSPTYEANQAEIATITSWAKIAKNGGIVLGIVFLTISVLVIFNTVRMSIFSRREEIYMMKLIGANKSFISGPFIVEAEMCGIISGIIAAILSCVGFNLLSPSLVRWGIDVGAISGIISSSQIVFIFLIFIAVGMFIGLLSAKLALRRYLKKA